MLLRLRSDHIEQRLRFGIACAILEGLFEISNQFLLLFNQLVQQVVEADVM